MERATSIAGWLIAGRGYEAPQRRYWTRYVSSNHPDVYSLTYKNKLSDAYGPRYHWIGGHDDYSSLAELQLNRRSKPL